MSIMGPRGIMTAIPVDEERRLKALNAIECFLSGQSFSRTQLFGVRSDMDKWHGRYLNRMVKDGAIQVVGSGTHRRIYTLTDREALLRFKNLFSEEDPLVREKGAGSTFTMTPEFRALFDGLLLGDGHYSKLISGGLSCCFQLSQREDRLEWLEKIKSIFDGGLIKSKISERPGYTKALKTGVILRARASHLLRTACYWNLKEERLRWYPEGIKIVPKDVDLSNPTTLAHWYMGDGSTSPEKDSITIATCGFSMADVEWIRSELAGKVGVVSVVHMMREFPNISMYGRHAERFLAIVRPYIVGCFQYKAVSFWSPNTCRGCGAIIGNRKNSASYCDNCCSKDESLERKKRDAAALSV